MKYHKPGSPANVTVEHSLSNEIDDWFRSHAVALIRLGGCPSLSSEQPSFQESLQKPKLQGRGTHEWFTVVRTQFEVSLSVESFAMNS